MAQVGRLSVPFENQERFRKRPDRSYDNRCPQQADKVWLFHSTSNSTTYFLFNPATRAFRGGLNK